MNSQSPLLHRSMRVIARYSTPLATALVVLGLLVSQPEETVRMWAVSLLISGILINLAFNSVLRGRKASLGWVPIRLIVNIAINSFLYFLLGPSWPSLWLLLALSPLATAVYGSRGQVLVVCGVISAILLSAEALRPVASIVEWGEQISHVLFIFLLSLMINDLIALQTSAAPKSDTREGASSLRE